VLGRLLEHIDERVPDAAPLLFPDSSMSPAREEEGARIQTRKSIPRSPEGLLQPAPVAQAQQSVIHENARQPIADGAVHQRGSYRESTPPESRRIARFVEPTQPSIRRTSCSMK